MRSIATSILCLALLGGCGGEAPEPPPTRVLIIWDSVDVEQLHACGAKHDTTPVLTALAREGMVEATFNPLHTSATASVARHLAHPFAITSIRELGHDRLGNECETVAASFSAKGWRTLASVSSPHFGYAGFSRGFDTWRAPELFRKARPRSAEEVLKAVQGDLTTALESDTAVFLFLHFGDLRGRKWIDRSEPDRWLEPFLSPWRGSGGEVDAAFASPTEDGERLQQLKRKLLRRRGDDRRLALLDALYAGELQRLDTVLGQVFDELRRAGRFESAEVCVVGGPAVLPEDVSARDAPGARLHTARVSRGWGEDPPLFDDESPFSWSFASKYTSVVAGRTGRVLLQEDSTGEVHTSRFLAQRLTLHFRGEQGDILNVTATSPEAELDVLEPLGGTGPVPGDEDVPVRPPQASTRRFKLSSEMARDVWPDRRGVDLLLRFALEGVREEDLSIAGRQFKRFDIPVLLARQSPPWTDEDGEPALNLRPVAGRRIELVVAGPEGAEVDLIVETFPPGTLLPEKLSGTGFDVEPHPLRPGAVRVLGRVPLTVVLPPRSPSSRLGIVLSLNGERVAADRMRYGDRRYCASDELEIGFGAGVWIDPAYRGGGFEFERTKGIEIVLRDPFAPSTEYQPPTPAERELLERLDENE
jgi:hypothetical protein